ncbi:MAG TPA: hypothetical protein VNZ53_21210 [Steroidobacteraceae bacterium]|jgi:hypothetical protein|nr:hypothetical protein [Steroidobacteraceae bacterium]
MSELLASALEAHGGLANWRRYTTVSADAVSGGELLDRKAPQSGDPRRMTVWMHEQRASARPFGSDDQRSAFRSDRVAIEKLSGATVAERRNPRLSFEGDDLGTPWDPLKRAYFNGYAMWSYLTVPFSLTLPGARVGEIEPIAEHGETWQGLDVIMPDNIATHSRIQRFYFGDDFLLRRQDYTLDVAGGAYVANYASEIVEIQGIRLPSKRRAYMCDDDYRPLKDRLLIWIDLTHLTFAR